MADAREEAVNEAVEALRAQVAEVGQHMQDVKTQATIASFLLDASRYAGSSEEYQGARASTCNGATTILLP